MHYYNTYSGIVISFKKSDPFRIRRERWNPNRCILVFCPLLSEPPGHHHHQRRLGLADLPVSRGKKRTPGGNDEKGRDHQNEGIPSPLCLETMRSAVPLRPKHCFSKWQLPGGAAGWKMIISNNMIRKIAIYDQIIWYQIIVFESKKIYIIYAPFTLPRWIAPAASLRSALCKVDEFVTNRLKD